MKIKHYTFFTESHRIFLKYFLNTFPFDPSVELAICYVPQECETGEYESDGFDKTMKRKVEIINEALDELKDGDVLFFTDADVIFLKPYKDVFLKEMGEYDIAFQNDTGTACMGVFACRVSNKTRFFFKDLYNNLEGFKHDQVAANHLLITKKYDLKYKFFSHIIFNYGFYGKRYEGEEDVLIPKDIVLLHANFAVGVDTKIKLIKKTLNYFNK